MKAPSAKKLQRMRRQIAKERADRSAGLATADCTADLVKIGEGCYITPIRRASNR